MESSPNDAVSTPSPIQTGSIRAAALIVWVSGNAVKTREEVTIDCESEVKVVEGSETVIGTAVVNVVRLENRDGDPEEVAHTVRVCWGLSAVWR